MKKRAYILIAAMDSPEHYLWIADERCDGDNDQAVMDRVAAEYRTLLLAPGTYRAVPNGTEVIEVIGIDRLDRVTGNVQHASITGEV